MHNHPFIHQLLDLCQPVIPTIVGLMKHCLQSEMFSQPSEHIFFLHLLCTIKTSTCFKEQIAVMYRCPGQNILPAVWYKCRKICGPLSTSQVLSDFTQSSTGAWAAVKQPSKERAKQWWSLSFWAWNQGLKARTRYARYHIQFHCQPLRLDETHWVCHLSSPQC